MNYIQKIKKDGTDEENQALQVITCAIDFLANNAHYNLTLYKKAARITNKSTIEVFNECKKLYDKIYDLRINFVIFKRIAKELRLSVYHILSLDYNINKGLIRYYKKYHFKPDNRLYMCMVRTFNRFVKKYSEKYLDK